MMDNEAEKIEVFGARVHNLKNVDVELPRNSLTVITGLSGSGKSSLAFDTIFAEGQRRYIETFSAYARNFLGNLERPDVDKITGLSPVISIEQKTTNKNPRSTVGTTTEIYDFLPTGGDKNCTLGILWMADGMGSFMVRPSKTVCISW